MIPRRGRNTITFAAAALIAASVIFVANEALNSFTDGFLEASRSQGRRSLSLKHNGRSNRQAHNRKRRRTKKKAKEHPVDVNSKAIDVGPFSFDPALIHKPFQEVEGLQEDGTYLLYHDIYRNGPNESCMSLVHEKVRIKRVQYHFASCKNFDTQFGNRLAVIYGMKMITYAMRKPFTFTCGKAEGESPSGAAYLMQLNSNVPGPVPNRDGVEYSPEEVCLRFCRGTFCSWYHDSLDLASDAMIADWKHLSSSEVLTMKDHDDAVIHLRLGDGLYSTVGANEGKGIFPHGTYIELLKQAVFEKGHLSSIGIVTAPFKGSQLRSFDVAYTSLSEMIVQDLIEALKIEFPFAEIKIHNSPYGSILESLSRVVNARKVAICGCSTFCPYALLARDGLGFMYHPSGAQNQWVRNAAQWHPNFRLFDTPMLNGLVIANHKYSYSMPQERVIRWLREQDPHVGNVDITKGPIFRYKMK